MHLQTIRMLRLSKPISAYLYFVVVYLESLVKDSKTHTTHLIMRAYVHYTFTTFISFFPFFSSQSLLDELLFTIAVIV